jgi:hypothetical protein
MPDLTTMTLAQLVQRCDPLTQPLSAAAEAAWHELLRRTLTDHSDAAWDALVNCLWFSVFTWLYARAPNLTPADAERVAQQVLLALREQALARGSTPVPATIPNLSVFLQQQIADRLAG